MAYKLYTIKSISDDGEWYLVNGWWKHKAYWQQKDNCTIATTFKRIQDAKRSLTKLLKVMEEYRTDDFTIVELEWNALHQCYDTTELEAIKYPVEFWKKYHKVICA